MEGDQLPQRQPEPEAHGVEIERQGWLGARRPVHAGYLACGKQFDHEPADDMAAVQLLLVNVDSEGWQAKPRCVKHPADADVRILAHAVPRFLYAVVDLRPPNPVPGRPGAVTAPESDISCGHCGSRNTTLILGGRRHGSIDCASCGEQLDPPKPAACPGCGCPMELTPVTVHKDSCRYLA